MASEKVVISFRADGTRVVQRDIKKIGTSAAASATSAGFLRKALLFVGVGAAVRNLVKTLAQFEQTLSTVKGVTGATDKQFAQLRDTAKGLGATTRFTATQAGEGLLFLARAGFDVQQSIEAIPGVLNLAQAGALGLGEAADIASNVLQGFRLSVDQTGRVVDVLAKAANSSNTDVLQLGEAMKFIAPVAASAGVSIEDTAAAVGALSNAGIQASLAGTGLRQAILRLAAPNGKAKKTLRELGLTAADVDVQTVGLIGAFERLGEAGLDLTDAKDIFGVRTASAALTLANAATEADGSLNRLKDGLDGAAGTAQRVADIMDDNLNGALLKVGAAFESVKLAIGEAGATTIFTDLALKLADALRFVAKNLDIVSEGIVAGLTPALIGMALAFNLNPIGLFITALSVAIGVLVTFREDIKLTEDGVSSLGDLFAVFKDNITEAFNAISDTLSTVFSPMLESADKSIGDTEKSFFGFVRKMAKIADLLTFPFQVAVITISTIFQFGFRAIGDLVVRAFNSILRALDGLLIGLQRRLNIFIDKLNKLSAQAGSIIGKDNGFGIGSVDIPQFGEIESSFENAGEDFARALEGGFRRLLEEGGFESIVSGLENQVKLKGQEREVGESNRNILAKGPDFSGNPLKVSSSLDDARAAGVTFGSDTGAPGDPVVTEELKKQKTLLDGFTGALDSINVSAEALGATIAEALVGSIDEASGALAEFALTGFQNFDQLRTAISDILADLAQQILQATIKALILKAITGGETGGGIIGALGGRAAGGPVAAGEAVIVGEKRPEIFQPTRSGNVIPKVPEQQNQMPPIQIINVTDPKEVGRSLEDPANERLIVNIIRKNKDQIR